MWQIQTFTWGRGGNLVFFPSISRLLLCWRGGQNLSSNWVRSLAESAPTRIRHRLTSALDLKPHAVQLGYFFITKAHKELIE